MVRWFSWSRFIAVMVKEFIHMRRDQVTIGMMIITPLIQLIIFGYAINVNPHHLPTVVVSADHSDLTRQWVTAMENTKYFNVINNNASEQQAEQLMTRGKATFIVTIPPNFSRDLIGKKKPTLLVTVDATDPAAVGSASSALTQLTTQVFNLQGQRGLPALQPQPPPFNLVLHNKYNPESITQYNIIPGLMGVILSMTSIMITALAMTKEREFGTMESLLATPVQPLEVMIGKIIPYIVIGYGQQILIWLCALFLFHVPSSGSVMLLMLATLPFIVANLTVGLTFSTLADNQLQAVQMSFFFFLPSILLSGFMFPFYGMPHWAQWLSQILPLTHFVRITRGIMLKGNGFLNIWPDIWPLLLFILVSGFICVKRYRRTLD
ncbi:MAG: ABC transporter permease [Gammaproteobacteria bacterium]|nr:ABC transporter permease [Gammaproteobacteria bacterium]